MITCLKNVVRSFLRRDNVRGMAMLDLSVSLGRSAILELKRRLQSVSDCEQLSPLPQHQQIGLHYCSAFQLHL